MLRPLDTQSVRRHFPGLSRKIAGAEAVFFDGPAGSQVPTRVAAAVSDYLLHHNANHGGPFATSVETDAMVDAARAAFADFFGASTPDEIVFGANMTTLTFHLARALARTWKPGDVLVVTDSDHDANVTPWVLAARDVGASVRRVPVRSDTTLDLDALDALLDDRTRLVAVGAASNLSGTIHDVRTIADRAHRHGALVFVDAVHFAAHCRIDVGAWNCDFVACSAYKFFGPHLGVLWGRQELLLNLEAYKVRPAPAHGPEKWQTGTAAFETIAGALAAVDYLADLGSAVGSHGNRRTRLDAAFAAIAQHEQLLTTRLLLGLRSLGAGEVIGLADPTQVARRCATVALVPRGIEPLRLQRALAERGIFAWAGHSYALALCESLGLLPHGVLRVGLLHYATAGEVDRLLEALAQLVACAGTRGA